MTSVSLQERLEAATEDLARCQVASDVAEILRVEGVQGERGQCKRCPVAVLLIKRLGPDVAVWVTESLLQALGPRGPVNWGEVETPRAVAAFIGEFDGDEILHVAPGWDEFAVTSP